MDVRPVKHALLLTFYLSLCHAACVLQLMINAPFYVLNIIGPDVDVVSCWWCYCQLM